MNMNTSKRMNIPKNKVVLFERGAEFYFDLGYKYIQKGKLKTALRYIEKAAMIKPEDSFLQFNYAGILAELGDINKSTEVLRNIIEQLDPDYSECYYGLGCNFLQLQKIKKSVEYFSIYLEKDPDGEFADEAEDLLEMLTMIKDANNNLDDEELEKIYKVEEEAINHLEKREYEKAVQKFEDVVRLLPNAVPARNNLSLTYYYLGNIDKAIELAREVLSYEEGNVHANCNLAIYYNKLNLQNWVEKQIKIVKRLDTDNEDYLYKIADTFGCLGKHQLAYKSYKKLLTLNMESPLYIHFAALSAYNSKKFKDSIILWERLKELESDNFLSDYYIVRAQKAMEEESPAPLTYIYQLPKEEIGLRLEKIYKLVGSSREESKKMLEQEPPLLEILYFGIIFDKFFLRKLIFNKIKSDGLAEIEPVLRKYILRKDIENYIKMEAIFLLSGLGVKEPFEAYFDGEIRTVSIDPLSFPKSEWKKEWESVKSMAYSKMKNCYKKPYKKIIEDIWYGFIKATYPEVPQIKRVDVWAAALEYAYCRFYSSETTQQQIAEKYNISKTSLSEKYRVIINAIGNKLDF